MNHCVSIPLSDARNLELMLVIESYFDEQNV